MSARMERNPIEVATDLLQAVRRGETPDPVENTLADLPVDRLDQALADPAAGRAFWINLYNSTVQLLFEREPSLYDDSRRRFFSTETIVVAGQSLSLDDMEHAILRDGKWKYGLGYLPYPFRGSFSRRFAVPVDPRIHFAINCGATSCPPVAVYRPDELDHQLDDAAASYLAATAAYDADRNVVTAPRQCLWYRGDFGGKAGILRLLSEHGIIPADGSPRVRYASYDWHPRPRNFA